MTNAQEYESLEQVIKTNPKQEEIQYFIDEVGEYNQKDAEGFIKINSIRLRKNN